MQLALVEAICVKSLTEIFRLFSGGAIAMGKNFISSTIFRYSANVP